MQKFYWLSGDRFLCICRKKEILSTYNNEIIEFTAKTADEFLSVLNQRDLFNNEKVFVHDGSVPENSKVADRLDAVKGVLIVLEGSVEASKSKVDNRTALAKKYKENIEYFEPIIDNGFPNKKLIPYAVNKIKSLVGNKIEESIICKMLEKNDYDYGKTVNEIEKVSIYLGGKIDGRSDYKDILCDNDIPQLNKVTELIINNDVEFAFKELNDIINRFDIKEVFLSLTGLIQENFQFMSYCKMALNFDLERADEIGNFVAKNWIKKGKPVDSFSCQKRYPIYRDFINKKEFGYFYDITRLIEDMNKKFLMEEIDGKYLLNSLLMEIFKIV